VALLGSSQPGIAWTQNAVIPNTSGYAEWGDPELNIAKRYDMLPEGAGDTSEGTTEARKLSE